MISVCIATFNGEKYIQDQIRSILNQLNAEDEIIVSDNGSSDDTVQRIQGLRDSRIKILHKSIDLSMSKADNLTMNFQNALAVAKGDYIFLSDQDDVWLPTKVSSCLNALSGNMLVVHDCIVVDKDLNIIFDSYFDLINVGPGYWKNFIKMRYLGCCIAFRKELLNRVLPFVRGIAHDSWICLVNELLYGSYCLKEPLLKYRRHGLNASSASTRSSTSLWFKVKHRLPMLVKPLFRVIKNWIYVV